MSLTMLELMRLFEQYDSEIDLADFSPEELQELEAQMSAGQSVCAESFKEQYFSVYDDIKDKSLKKQDW